jgi:hypothetical protein
MQECTLLPACSCPFLLSPTCRGGMPVPGASQGCGPSPPSSVWKILPLEEVRQPACNDDNVATKRQIAAMV